MYDFAQKLVELTSLIYFVVNYHSFTLSLIIIKSI